uniref:Rho GTPase activating protein 7 n=1 Tax=Echinococcus granulosus TaxID=6210 RepID=A0A068WHX1_ECHGR|nr:rho GTPase activating protein 7 [Echinococcus granulosus]
MSFPSEYSVKSTRGISRRSAGSAGTRFVDFIRSLFQSVFAKPEMVYEFSIPTTVAPCLPISSSLKRHQTTPPVRSFSQYEYLSDARKNTFEYGNNVTPSSTQFVLSRSPHPPPPHPSIRTIDQFYTPQIKRSNVKRISTEAARLHDIRIVDLGEGLMRAHLHDKQGEECAIRAEPRTIYSESVEIDVRSTATQQFSPLPRKLDKRVISVANIAVDGSRATAFDIQPQLSNVTKKKISLKYKSYDRLEQPNQVSEGNKFKQQMAIKEKILAEWERSRYHDEQGPDSSFSSLVSREEPMMVDDDLKEIPSPNLRQYYASADGCNELKKSEWKVHRDVHCIERDGGHIYEGEFQEELESRNNNRQNHKSQSFDFLNQCGSVMVRRGHSFSTKKDSDAHDKVAENKKDCKYVHISSLAPHLADTNPKCNLEICNYSSNSQYWKTGNKRLCNAIILPASGEVTEADYEFLQVKGPLLTCPQSVPLTRKTLGVRANAKSVLLPSGISHQAILSFSADNRLVEPFSALNAGVSSSDPYQYLHSSPNLKIGVQHPGGVLIQRSVSVSPFDIPVAAISMAKMKQGNKSQELSDQTTQVPILCPSNFLYPSDQNSLGDALKNDSIDLGETGCINYRTGSFLGTFMEHTMDNRKSRKSDASCFYSKSRSGQTLNDYLLSRQIDGTVLPTDDNNKQSFDKTDSTKQLIPKVSIELSKTAELDPVLELLQSDVSQLDEFRNNFREKGVRGKKTLKVSLPVASHCDKKGVANHARERQKAFNATSVSSPTIKQEDVDDAQRDLTSRIHSLVDIEFSSTAKKTTIKKQTTKTIDRDQKDHTIKEPLKEVGPSLLRVRQHHFRWSERHQRPSPYIPLRPSPSPMTQKSTTKEVKEKEIVPLVNGAPKFENSQSQHQGSQTRIISMLIPHMQDGIPIWVFSAGQLNVLRRMAQTQITLTHEQVCRSNRLIKWRIGSSKNAQARAPATITPAVSQGEQNQGSTSIVLSQQTDSRVVDSRLSPMNPLLAGSKGENSSEVAKTPDSTNSSPAFWPELKDTEMSSTEVVAVNAYGASRSFSGPLFGRSLEFWQHRVGYPFPPCICNMLAYLQQVEHAAHGIFRRAGGKLRVQALREQIEKNINWSSFDEWQPYDVADLLKQFFRELPECLLTNVLSSNLINIFHHAPEVCTIDLLRLAMISLPDVNRIGLQSLLQFLYALSLRCSLTQMSALNLAICLAPSLFHFSSLLVPSTAVSPLLANFGSRRRKKLDPLGGLEPKDLAEQVAAQKCLCALITYAPSIFMVTESIVLKTRLDTERIEIPRLSSVLSATNGDANLWLQQQVETLLRDCGSSIAPAPLATASATTGAIGTAGTGAGSIGTAVKCAAGKQYWSSLTKEALKAYSTDSGEGEALTGFEISISKPTKTSQQQYAAESISPFLRTWRCSILFPVKDPQLIADKYWNERVSWDENVLRSEVMEELILDRVQIHRVLFNALPPQPARESRLLRGRQVLMRTKGAESTADELVTGVAIVSTSVNHGVVVPEVPQELLPSAHFSKEHLLIERITAHSRPSCRVTLISEADIKGFSQEWYTNQWGHYLLRRLLALRHCFVQRTEPVQDLDSPPFPTAEESGSFA